MAGLLSTINLDSLRPEPAKPIRPPRFTLRGKVPPPSNRAVTVCAIVGLVVAGSGLWAEHAQAYRPLPMPDGVTSPLPATRTARPVEQAGPSMLVNFAPAGFAHTEAGARAAAVAFVAHVGQAAAYLAPSEVEPLVRQVASERNIDTVLDSISAPAEHVRYLSLHGEGAVWWIVSPLAVRVDSMTDDTGTVSVWTSQTWSAPLPTKPTVTHSITRLGLVWERDDWRIDTFDVTPTRFITDPFHKRVTGYEVNEQLVGFTPLGFVR